MTGLRPRPGSPEELAAYDLLEQMLPAYAKAFAGDHDGEHALVVAASNSVDPEVVAKLKGPEHYEERMMAMLLLLRRPRTRVVFCSSQRIPEPIVDYYLHLLTGVPKEHALRRLTMISCDDGSTTPLTQKLLDRPRRLDDIRRALRGADTTGLISHLTTDLERSLAVELGVPLYGNDPALADLGTKSASREVFREAGIDLPDGVERLRDTGDVVTALAELKGRHPGLRKAVVKLEEGFSGEGNAVFAYDGVDATTDQAREVQIASLLGDRLRFVAPDQTWDAYREKFDEMGGIVEEFLDGTNVCSPSAQLRIDPTGFVQPLSTHDQILGGADGQVFEGSTFPADASYRTEVASAARVVGDVLLARGARGRFAVDFVVLNQEGRRRCAAIEVNLRMGGTTYPMLTLELLAAGHYDADRGEYLSKAGRPKTYLATDDLEQVRYRGLSAEDLIDLAVGNHLHYDPRTESGVVFHMLGSLSEFGKIGMTCIADTLEEARAIDARVVAMLDQANERT